MDKLDNETWEDYAFRTDLFSIEYQDKEKQIISYIGIPDHTNLPKRHYRYTSYLSCGGGSFLEQIMHQLCILSHKYDMELNDYRYSGYILGENGSVPKNGNDNITLEEREKDSKRQKWLIKELEFWENKEKEKERNWIKSMEERKKIMEVNKVRYSELKLKISETYKEEFTELIDILIDTPMRFMEANNEQNNNMKNYRESYEIQKKNDIELYKKYFKKIELKTKITELEQQINQLKDEINQ